MPRKPAGRRKANRFLPFDVMSYFFEINSLMDDPYKQPSEYELQELQKHGLTIEQFRNNYDYFKQHRDELVEAQKNTRIV